MIGVFSILGRPVSEELIQIRGVERHGDGQGVRGRSRAEFAPNVERPRGILNGMSPIVERTTFRGRT